MRWLLAFAIGLCSLPTTGRSECVCRCVNGEMQPICSSALDLPPICPPTICQIVPPSIQPIPRPMIPPVGTTSCQPEQVLNPATRLYEWRTICR
jgi:hypothetical protein